MSGKHSSRARLWRVGATALAGLLTLGSLPVGLSTAAPTGDLAAQGRAPFAPKQLIFISDGMRPDLVEKWKADLPNYARIFDQGVTGENGMVSQIAGNTAAGWSSISTGSWTGTHGQVNNTFHIVNNGILTSTAGFDGARNQAETYAEVVEKSGKKVAILDWPGTLPTRIKGPAVDFRNFYSSRGVVSNYPVEGYRPDPGLVYTNTLQFTDATGWSNVPQSFGTAKETSFFFRTNPITNTVVTLTFPIYIYDSTDDQTVNYDHAIISSGEKTGDLEVYSVDDVKAGEWAPFKVTLPQNGLLVGNYMKLMEMSPDLSRFKLYFTSLARARSNLPDLEQTIASATFIPPVTAADFAPLQSGLIDADTYAEQGLFWYASYRFIHEHVIKNYTPDVVMAGYPVTDEFSHQFMALATPGYTGPRLVDVDTATAEGYIKSAYMQADEVLGDLWGLMGGADQINTFVGSDHGFAPTWKSVNVNQVLQDAGLYDSANRGQSKAVGYIAGGTGNIYINLAGREVGGVVTTTDYVTVQNQIVAAFSNLSDGDVKVASKVLKKDELRTIQADGSVVNAWHPTRSGDVLVLLRPPYQFDASTAGRAIADAPFYGQHGFMPDLVDIPNNINLHSMFGMYGPNVAKGKKLTNPAVVDLAPTAAYAFGIPAPRWSEGRILTEAFVDTPANLVPIQVLGWSDYHGQLDPVDARIDNVVVRSGGVALIGAYWKEAKARNPNGTIILSDGDNIGATPPNSAFLNDNPTIDAMNMLGFTASAAGNHEFDKGVAGFREKQSRAQFSYLADNILDEKTGQLADFAEPYVIVKANGIDVGIIGAANPETPSVTSPQGIAGYRWVDPLEPTNRYVKELVGKGVQTIIVTYHQGSASGDFDSVNGIWANFIRGLDPEVDMVFGGHTRIKTMTRVNGILVSAANHALETSEHTLLVDPATKDVVWSWGAFRRPLTGAITPDPALAALVKQATDTVQPILGEEVGTAAALVDRSRGAESKMGNFVSDAIRATYQVDVALQNSGGLRADFSPGPITKGHVFAVLPFGNLVVTGKLKGSDLLAALENGVSDVSGTAGRFIQLSGVRFAFDASKPVGQRVLWAVLSDGRALDPNATYSVATNDFMQVGGDGYTSLVRMTEVASREQLWEVAANYVASVGTVDPQIEGRIIAVQAGQPAPTPPAAVTPALPTPVSVLPTAAPVPPTAVAQPTAVTQPPVEATPGTIPGMPTTGSGSGGMEWLWALLVWGLALLIVGALVLKRRPVQ